MHINRKPTTLNFYSYSTNNKKVTHNLKLFTTNNSVKFSKMDVPAVNKINKGISINYVKKIGRWVWKSLRIRNNREGC